VLDQANKSHADVCGSERSALGFDHSNLGGELLSSWNLPSFLVEAAGSHHEELILPEKSPILSAVTLADILASRAQPNVAPNAPRQQREEVAKFFGVSTDEDITTYHAACRLRFELFGAALR
jgi:HD-like signal output (HDOD) protein